MKYPKKEWKEWYTQKDVEELVKKGKWLGTYQAPASYGEKPSSSEKTQSHQETAK